MLTTEWVAATEAASRRVMILLHGLGDSMEGYRWAPQAMGFPWLNYLLVNAPDAYYTGFSWYDFAGDPAPGIRRSRELLFRSLDSLREKGFATEQTILFGFSQGCLMTLETGLLYPHRFAGLIGVSGYAHEPERLISEMSPVAKQQRFLMTHGTGDGLVPIEPVRAQIQLFQRAGLSLEWREFAKGHTIEREELVMIRDFVNQQLGR
jgi:phospholipase/carboxylesterase